MGKDKQLEKVFGEYQELAKKDKSVDVAALMINALQNQNRNLVSAKTKRWAYLISIGVPPFGFLLALKFLFDEKDDAKQVAYTCITLTVISVFAFWLLSKAIFSSSGTSLDQIQQIKPSDIQQLVQ